MKVMVLAHENRCERLLRSQLTNPVTSKPSMRVSVGNAA